MKCSSCPVFRPIVLLLWIFHLMYLRNTRTRKLISVNTYEGNFSHQSLLCFARTRLHLWADNRPWKENYNQSRGRKEGTAHALQPNILIYKESIKYLKSKVDSQSAHWWLDWGISVYFNSIFPSRSFPSRSFSSSQAVLQFLTSSSLLTLPLSFSPSHVCPCSAPLSI